MLNLAKARIRIEQITASAPRQWFTWNEAREYLMKAKVDSDYYAYAGDGKTEIIYGAYSVDAKPYKGSKLFSRKDLNNLISMVQEDRRDKGLPLEAAEKSFKGRWRKVNDNWWTYTVNDFIDVHEGKVKHEYHVDIKLLGKGKWKDYLVTSREDHKYDGYGFPRTRLTSLKEAKIFAEDWAKYMLQSGTSIPRPDESDIKYNSWKKDLTASTKPTILKNPNWNKLKKLLDGAQYEELKGLISGKDVYWWNNVEDWHHHHQYEALGKGADPTDPFMKNPTWNKDGLTIMPIKQDMGDNKKPLEGFAVVNKAANEGVDYIMKNSYLKKMILDNGLFVDNPKYKSNKEEFEFIKGRKYVKQHKLEASDDPYGYWITDTGSLLKVQTDLTGHIGVLELHEKQLGLNLSNKDWDDINDANYAPVLKKGWIRIVFEGYDKIGIEIYKDSVTQKAATKLIHVLGRKRYSNYTLDVNKDADRVDIDYVDSENKGPIISKLNQNISKTLVEASDEYGGWIDEDGKFIEVNFEQHSSAADKFIAKSLYNEYAEFVNFTGIASSTNFCLSRGWIRIVNEETLLSIELCENSITKPAYKSLIKYIDNNNFEQFVLEKVMFSDHDTEHRYERFDLNLRNPRQRFLAAVRENISRNSITAFALIGSPKQALTLDENNNELPANSNIVESWSSPEGYKIHLLSMLVNGNQAPKYTILMYSPTGQMTRDDPEYDFLETAREGLLELVNKAKPDIVYSRIGEIMAAEDDPKTLERYETEDGKHALELKTQGNGYDIVQFTYNQIAKIWQKMGAYYKPTKEKAEDELKKLLYELRSMKYVKVEPGVKLPPRSNKDGFKLHTKQPDIPGLELFVETNGKTRYAKIVHKESGRTVFAFVDKPLDITYDELIKRMNMSKDLAAIDWTLTPVKLDQRYKQTEVLNKVTRFRESLALPLPDFDLSGKTQIAMDEGLKGWVKDFLVARYFNNVTTAKAIRNNIDRVIKQKGLNTDDVYFYYGNPSDPKDRVWEKIGLTRTRKGTNYTYETANKTVSSKPTTLPKKPSPVKISVKTETKPAVKPTVKVASTNQKMVGFQVEGVTSTGKKIKGILIKQSTVKGKTSGVILYMKSGKPTKATVSRVFRVYEDIDKTLLKAAKTEIKKQEAVK